MKTQIVTTRVRIQRMNEIQHFEIRIPDNVNKITAIEYGIRCGNLNAITDVDDLEAQLTIVEIKLKGAIQSEWFYSGSLTDVLSQFKALTFLDCNNTMVTPYQFQRKREKELLTIYPNTTRIKGFAKDVIGARLELNLSYTITICLHLELNN